MKVKKKRDLCKGEYPQKKKKKRVNVLGSCKTICSSFFILTISG